MRGRWGRESGLVLASGRHGSMPTSSRAAPVECTRMRWPATNAGTPVAGSGTRASVLGHAACVVIWFCVHADQVCVLMHANTVHIMCWQGRSSLWRMKRGSPASNDTCAAWPTSMTMQRCGHLLPSLCSSCFQSRDQKDFMDSKLFHARIATIAAKLQVLRVLALAGARPIPARHVDIPEINRDVRG